MRSPLALVVVVALGACPLPPGGEGDGEGDPGEGEGEGEGEGDVGEGEGEGEQACGDVVVVGTSILNTEGLVVARDGTLYFSQNEAVGRRTPDGAVLPDWVLVPGASTLWGVMLSPDNQRLYAASPSTSSIFVIDTVTESIDFELTDFQGPNGLTIDAAGTLFVADFFADTVYALDVGTSAATTTTTVVTTEIVTPNGVLVDGDDLLVLGYNDGVLHRAVGGRIGAASSLVDEVSDLGNPDGIVRAADGSLFITDNGNGLLLHVEDGVGVVVRQGIPAAANLEFGTAPLRCDRLMVTSAQSLAVVDVGIGGAPVAWR